MAHKAFALVRLDRLEEASGDVTAAEIPVALAQARMAGLERMKMAEKTRCWWPGEDPLYLSYHDTEWGVPEYDAARAV